MDNIKDKQLYFIELSNKLENNFDFLFKDENFELNNYLNKRLYSNKEFQIFKKNFPFNFNENRLLYIFEHSQQFAEIKNFNIQEYYLRMIKSEIKTTKKINGFIRILESMPDKVSLDGFCEIFNQDDFKKFVNEIPLAEFDIENDTLKEDKKFALKLLNKRIKDFTDDGSKLDYVLKNIADLFYKQANIENQKKEVETTYVFNTTYDFKKEKPDYYLTLTGSGEDAKYYSEQINPEIIKFWTQFNKDNFFNPINNYLDEKLKAYNKYLETLTFDSNDCRMIKTILYWLTYLGAGNSYAKEHMNNIKNAKTNWATGTEKTSNPSFYGNSKFAKALSSYYSFITAKQNPYKKIINNKEHQMMDKNAIALHKLFGKIGLEALGIGDVIDNISIVKDVATIIDELDKKLIVNVNLGSYIKGFISSIVNSVAQLLDFTITNTFQQLFFLKLLPINGKKVSISDLYNYLNFIRFLIENIDNTEELNSYNKDFLINESLNKLGVNIAQFREIGFGAYDKKLNSSSGIVFFIDKLQRSPKNNKTYFTVFEDLPILYTLIEFALEKRAFNGDYYAKKNIIFGNEEEINTLLASLSIEEICFIFRKFDVDLFNENKYYYIDRKFIQKVSSSINTNILRGILEGTKLYQEYKESNFYNLKEESQNTAFVRHYTRFIDVQLAEYFSAIEFNKKAITTTTYEDQDLGDFDDFLTRFLPSIFEIAKLFGAEKATKEELLSLINMLMNFITTIMFERVLMQLRDQINNTISHVQEEFFKAVDKKTEKLRYLDTQVEIDLGLGQIPLIKSMLKTINFIDEFIEKIPKSIIPCFVNGDYDEAERILTERKRKYEGNLPDFKNDEEIDENGEPEKNNKDEDNINYNNSKQEIIYHYLDGNKKKVVFNEREEKNNINKTNNKNEEFKTEKTITETIISKQEDVPLKIVYKNGKVELIFKSGKREIILNNNEKKIRILGSKEHYLNIKPVEKEIEKILSKDSVQRIKEIKNFLDRINNLEYYSTLKEIKNLKKQLNNEINKPLANNNEIKKLRENIKDLTFKLENVKKSSILNTVTKNEEIPLVNFKSNNEVNINKDMYRNLDEFFNKKIEVLKEVDNMLSDTKNKETYLTTYQITQLLK